MFHTFLGATVLIAALLAPPASAAPLTLQAALDRAVQRSETARASRASLLSASEAAQAAAQLPDPMLRVGVDNLPVTGADRFSTTREPMTMKRIGVSQEWLSRGKRDARSAAAEAEVQRESIQVEAVLAETRLQTALAYLDAFYAGEALKLTALMEHHAHEELEAARGRLASLTGGSQEVLALIAARGSAEDESAQVRQEQSAALVTLQRWIGVRNEELRPPPEMRVPTEDEFVAAHPSVLLASRELALGRQQAAVTASERDPNWTWGISYGQRTGYSDLVSFGVSIPLPLSASERQDRDTAAKLALADKAEADLAEASRAASAEYRALVSDSERLQERIERYRASVLTPATQRIAAATAAYASNQSNLVALFEARHAEVVAQRKLLSLRRDAMRARLQLRLKPLAQGAAP